MEGSVIVSVQCSRQRDACKSTIQLQLFNFLEIARQKEKNLFVEKKTTSG